MAFVPVPGLIPSSVDLLNMVPIGISVLGTPVYDDITFPAGAYINNEGVTIDYAELKLQSVQVTINEEKNIIETPVSGRKGTVDEFVNEGDYIIMVTAKVTELFNVVPFDQLERWRRIKESPESIPVISKLLNSIFDVYKVLIRNFSMDTIPGSLNEVDLSFEMKSTVDFNPEEFIL